MKPKRSSVCPGSFLIAVSSTFLISSAANAGVSKVGSLVVNQDETISTYSLDGGTLSGPGTLTVTDGATLNDGTISGHLAGNLMSSTGQVLVSGALGGDALVVTDGKLTLSGTSSQSSVTISELGILEDSKGGLSKDTSLINHGMLTLNANETVANYTQWPGYFWSYDTPGPPRLLHPGILAGGAIRGTGTLTVTGATTLNGGTIAVALHAETVVVGGGTRINGSLTGTKLELKNGGSVQGAGAINFKVIETFKGGGLQYVSNLGGAPDVINGGYIESDGVQTLKSLVNNGGFVSGVWNVTGATVFNGGIIFSDFTAVFHAFGGATLNDGTTIQGELNGNTTTHGNVLVSGTTGGGDLHVASGTLSIEGASTNGLVEISRGASLVDAGDLGDTAAVVNAGILTVTSLDTIGSLIHQAAVLDGSGTLTVAGEAIINGGLVAANLTANGGVTLTDGTKVSGNLQGNTISLGDVWISGSVGNDLHVKSGTLTLTGSARSNTTVDAGATLRGGGGVDGNLSNGGTLKVDSATGTMKITGSLVTQGNVVLSLKNMFSHETITVGGSANFGGKLTVTNTGTGLLAGQAALLVDAGSYEGKFTSFEAVGFDSLVLFNDSTGELFGVTNKQTSSTKSYLNLNESQTSVYLALYEDSIGLGERNVTIGTGAEAGQRAARAAAPTVGGIHFSSGFANGDSQLVEALQLAATTTAGSISAPVINRLSPEVHRGLADYTEQATRSHVQEAVDTAPVSRSGRIQVFGSLHSSTDDVESTATAAGYNLDISGVTSGVRYDIGKHFQIGGLLGVDDGDIQGPLVDTDAQGLVVGAFGRYRLDEAGKTVFTASAAYGSYNYDTTRHSFGGDASAGNVGSGAFELAAGVRSVVFEKDGFRVIPNAALRYLTGGVDGFREHGSGVDLRVDSQDIESLLLDVGVDFEYQVRKQITLTGSIGYLNDFKDSAEPVSATFAASGAQGTPFHVSAPGIDDEAFTVGLGAFYDINERARVGFNYLGEFHTDSEYSQNFGISASYGF